MLFSALETVSWSSISCAIAIAFFPHNWHSSVRSIDSFNFDILLYAIAFAFEEGCLSKTSIACTAYLSACPCLPSNHQSLDKNHIQLPIFSWSFFSFHKFSDLVV